MQIVIRTDASYSIGTGHVIRCLTLADALTRKGANVSFICREHDGHLCNLIEERGYTVHRLQKPEDTVHENSELAHAAWLGASWKQDVDQTSECIKGLKSKPDWLVVDHYGIDSQWEQCLRPQVSRILVIDDLADRDHDCDVLLDQNLVADMSTRYFTRVPKNCTCLLGPDYALLQPIYADLHDRIPPREGPVRRILISFGGTDSDNLTGRALEAFISLNRPDIEVDVVITIGNQYTASLQKLAAIYPNIHLHSNLPTLAPLIAAADLAIGAAGTTSWERLCLGLPALVVTLAENQHSVAINLHRNGLIKLIGHKDQVNMLLLSQTLNQNLYATSLFDWSSRCMKVCDGKGLSRVQDLLITLSL